MFWVYTGKFHWKVEKYSCCCTPWSHYTLSYIHLQKYEPRVHIQSQINNNMNVWQNIQRKLPSNASKWTVGASVSFEAINNFPSKWPVFKWTSLICMGKLCEGTTWSAGCLSLHSLRGVLTQAGTVPHPCYCFLQSWCFGTDVAPHLFTILHSATPVP